jgi:putative ABC transport system permease protein
VAHDFLNYLRSQPEVELIDTYRNLTVSVNGAPVFLGVITGANRNIPEFIGGKNLEKFQAFRLPDRVIISEPLSRRLKLNQGDSVTIMAPLGPHSFQIAGVFYDYSRDSGVILMQRATFERLWRDSRINSLSLYLRPGSNIKQMIESIRRGYPNASDYSIYSNRALRDAVVEVFDQTFAVTQILRLVAVLVSVIGVFLNVAVLAKEREREIATFRAVGVSRWQICGIFISESLLAGIIAVLLGTVAGVALSVILTEVINKAFFGWTIALRIPWDQLLWTPFWLLPVAAIASMLPATQAARKSIIDSIRLDA